LYGVGGLLVFLRLVTDWTTPGFAVAARALSASALSQNLSVAWWVLKLLPLGCSNLANSSQ